MARKDIKPGAGRPDTAAATMNSMYAFNTGGKAYAVVPVASASTMPYLTLKFGFPPDEPLVTAGRVNTTVAGYQAFDAAMKAQGLNLDVESMQLDSANNALTAGYNYTPPQAGGTPVTAFAAAMTALNATDFPIPGRGAAKGGV